MQLHLCFFWYLARPHEDAQWGKAFQVQQMQQSLQEQDWSHKTFPKTHDIASDWSTILPTNLNLYGPDQNNFKIQNNFEMSEENFEELAIKLENSEEILEIDENLDPLKFDSELVDSNITNEEKIQYLSIRSSPPDPIKLSPKELPIFEVSIQKYQAEIL